MQHTKYDIRNTRHAFTMIELLVAISVLVIILSTTGIIFKVCIDSQRKAGALAEIMRNLRGITDQLDRDFAGLQKDAPIAMWFEYDGSNRYDRIVFFASGEFQSTRQYLDTGLLPPADITVSGNVARIFYGQAANPNILSRKQKILTANTGLAPTVASDPHEYEQSVLSYWKTGTLDPLVLAAWINPPPVVDTSNAQHIPLYMVGGIQGFTIQFENGFDAATNEIIWWPDSSILVVGTPSLHLANSSAAGWTPIVLPRAVKFTFTLYDLNGILDGGRTFTHIVYLE